MPKGQSFTIAFDQLVPQLVVVCHVTAAFDPTAAPPNVQAVQFNAIWDTGATASVITQEVIDALGLVATGVTPVQGVHGKEMSDTFLVNIMLPNGVGYPGVLVTRGKMPPGSPMLIGMDIIGSGDFAVSNFEGKTVMSFRVPSCKRVDFVQEHNSDMHKEHLQGLIKHRHGHKKKKKKR